MSALQSVLLASPPDFDFLEALFQTLVRHIGLTSVAMLLGQRAKVSQISFGPLLSGTDSIYGVTNQLGSPLMCASAVLCVSGTGLHPSHACHVLRRRVWLARWRQLMKITAARSARTRSKRREK